MYLPGALSFGCSCDGHSVRYFGHPWGSASQDIPGMGIFYLTGWA